MASTKTETTLLLAGLDEAFDRSSWHGPNMKSTTKGLTVETAIWRPAPGRHNVWELLVHAAFWKYVARRRLTGDRTLKFAHPGKNFFPSPESPTEAALLADIALLVSEHRRLRETVEAMREFTPRVLRMIRGVAAHDVYHAGQIQLLKRLQP